jgi:hypothetical protein
MKYRVIIQREVPLYLDEKIIKNLSKQKPYKRFLFMLEANQFAIDIFKQGLKSRHSKTWHKYFKKIMLKK